MMGQYSKPASCDNLDFRKGNFDGWVGRTSVYKPTDIDANNCSANTATQTVCPNESGLSCNGCYSLDGKLIPPADRPLGPISYYDSLGIVDGRHTIMTNPVGDPFTCGNVLTIPPGEPFAARLGNGGRNPDATGTTQPGWTNGVGWQGEYLSYSYVVDKSNSLLQFKYAVVFQNPVAVPHSDAVRPRFVATVKDEFGKIIGNTCGKFDAVYNEALPGFRTCSTAGGAKGRPYATGNTVYRSWTTVGVDLRPYIGQKITLEYNTWELWMGWSFWLCLCFCKVRFLCS